MRPQRLHGSGRHGDDPDPGSRLGRPEFQVTPQRGELARDPDSPRVTAARKRAAPAPPPACWRPPAGIGRAGRPR
ncbi:hypothetical protein GCM10023176_38000 [Micromonospora coerulea]|uniref:Uncharacterized protein n=1 Tax=Micromonospora coerulea TaxID=47856 RepID=A0ABP8SRY7_9ACTN